MSQHSIPIYHGQYARETFRLCEEQAAADGLLAKQRLHLAAGGLNTLIGALGIGRLGDEVRVEATLAVTTALRQIAIRHTEKDRFIDLLLDKMQRDYARAEATLKAIRASLKNREDDLGDGPPKPTAPTPAPASSAQTAAEPEQLPAEPLRSDPPHTNGIPTG